MANSSTTGSDICFVLMPFGTKSNPFPDSVQIDFDRIFDHIIAPAIEKAGLRPLRADQEISGGLIHQAMFERLLACEYAIADLTSANPNVYYELGVRHAVRPWSTVLMCADKTRLPFDVEPLRALLYSLDDSGLSPKNATTDTEKLYQRLKAIKDGKSAGSVDDDSPLFELLKHHGYTGPDLSAFGPVLAGKANEYSNFKAQLSAARDLEALKHIESGLDALSDEHGPALVDLFMAYRQVMGWPEMVLLFEKIPANLRGAVCVQEQYAMALGRLCRFDEAEDVLGKLIETRGPSTLTYCFLGVVRKVRLLKARKEGDDLVAQGAMDAAIDAFIAGFRIDPSVVFCGINAVLLMHARDPADQRLSQIFPVVRYFVDTATSPPNGSFWNRAAELELAILDEDQKRAMSALARLVVAPHEPWMPFSICANLQLLREDIRIADLIYILPPRFVAESTKSSIALRTVADVLAPKFAGVAVTPSGVIVPRGSLWVKVLPSCAQRGAYLIPGAATLTRASGWGISNPIAEAATLRLSDSLYGGRPRLLLTALKAWREAAKVPIAAFALELLVQDFYASAPRAFELDKALTEFWAWSRLRTPCRLTPPGAQSAVEIDTAWHGKAKAAYWRVTLAEHHLKNGKLIEAAVEWRQLLGLAFPVPGEAPLKALPLFKK